MTNQLDYFADLLEGSESIRSALAGPGTDADGAAVWFQIAATETRLLVVELRSTPSGGWLPHRRSVVLLSAVEMSRHQRTESTAGTLHIDGPQLAVVIADIDRTDVFPMVEPLIVAWGGRLGGTGTERPVHTPSANDEPKTNPRATENHRLMVLCLGCLGLLIAACATTGCLGTVLAAALELR